MRVGVNARTFGVDEPGGAVQSAINHTKGLINHGNTDVILFGHESISSMFPDTTIVSTGYPTSSQLYGLLWERTVLPQLGNRYDIDVLYCPNGNAPVTETSFRVAMCLHDVNAMKGWSSGAHQIYRKIAVPRSAEVVDTIITVSEFSAEEINTHLGVPMSKIEVVYNGIDDFFFSGESKYLPELSENYILFVGSLNPRKNIKRVIKSFAKVQQSIEQNYNLVIIGPDNKSIFKNMNISEAEDIITPGFVSKAELKYAYEQADAFVFPSLYEGFGLPPLEALACGTPAVTSTTTSLGEIMKKGCIQVNPKSIEEISLAILRLLRDNCLSDKLGTEGMAYSKEFTWQSASESLYEALKST
ncbi:glycosyltransferase family 1 protein [Haloarcula sp. Atlit-7R]|uniref:glycosyltransferase family 4 protein n=1 Tax=Haloarcula sp. Atlit-7R TaxID=2282125 RepID=UPI000EF14232|nr:glycosyltransferase family 1 protein [Haloarcula sp. Atlit-7R]RLM95886.1 glycosyltransferase family 1 protein [Haloarcula sp. Atlit-7R]